MNQSTSPKGFSSAEVSAILIAIGIPAGVVTAFHDFVFAHPVPSLVIGILYVVMAGSVFVLWQRLINLSFILIHGVFLPDNLSVSA